MIETQIVGMLPDIGAWAGGEAPACCFCVSAGVASDSAIAAKLLAFHREYQE